MRLADLGSGLVVGCGRCLGSEVRLAVDANFPRSDSQMKRSSNRAESLTPAVRMNMYFADSTDAFAARPERDSTVVAAVAAPDAADTPTNDSSCLSSPVTRVLDSWGQDTRIHYQNPDDRRQRQSYVAANDQDVRAKLAALMKSPEQKTPQGRGGHACDSLDHVGEGSGHLDHHTLGSALGT